MPELYTMRYGRLKENVLIRIQKRVLKPVPPTQQKAPDVWVTTTHTAMYELRPACLNDVGAYYCSREHKDCLSGFQRKQALRAHLDRPKDDNKPHILLWLCRYHGPEVMFPMDGDEPLNLSGPIGMSNQAIAEHQRAMMEYREN